MKSKNCHWFLTVFVSVGCMMIGPAHAQERNPSGPRHGAGHEMMMEERTFLGVATTPLDPSLRSQLNLDEGIGLLVHDVGPDSPAASVLKPHDVLLQFQDQWLVSHEQLAILVRREAAGEKVSLTLIRNGKEKEVSATLEMRNMPVPTMLGHGLPTLQMDRRWMPPGNPDWSPQSPMPDPHLQERMEDLQREMEKRASSDQDARKRLQEAQREMEETRKRLELQAKEARERVELQMKKAEEQRKRLQDLEMKSDEPSGKGKKPKAKTEADAETTVKTLNAQVKSMVWMNDEVRMTLVDDSTSRILTIMDQGEEVFRGPVKTEDQKEAIPESYRKDFDQLESQLLKDSEGEEEVL